MSHPGAPRACVLVGHDRVHRDFRPTSPSSCALRERSAPDSGGCLRGGQALMMLARLRTGETYDAPVAADADQQSRTSPSEKLMREAPRDGVSRRVSTTAELAPPGPPSAPSQRLGSQPGSLEVRRRPTTTPNSSRQPNVVNSGDRKVAPDTSRSSG